MSIISGITGFFKTILARPGRLIILLVVLAGLGWWIFGGRAKKDSFQYATVTKGDLTINISATGTVEPEDVVDVGAQVAGQIISFGVDTNGKQIDYGSELKENQVIAKIDDTLYQSALVEANAQLKSAQAQVVQAKAKLRQAERDWQRAQKLGVGDALSKSSFDAYQATSDSAAADVGVADAAVTQAEAAVTRAKRNVEYCTILSPVSGVVIDRKVNIGQTVVSSLNAPSLFLIAKDLKKIQVWVSVNEADIGKVKPGQQVAFSVDAFPGEQFEGTVKKIRLNATMSQNVVTYIVEVQADNANAKLIPYLTANVRFQVSSQKNALLVPNAALTWTPDPSQVAEHSTAETNPSASGLVWVDDGNGKVKPVPVATGDSDGINTAVTGEGISENANVIVGTVIVGKKDDSGASVNPFLPTMPKGMKRGH